MSEPTEQPHENFEQLFRDTRTDLLAYILRRSRNAEDAADVLAETYLIAWQKLDRVPKGERAFVRECLQATAAEGFSRKRFGEKRGVWRRRVISADRGMPRGPRRQPDRLNPLKTSLFRLSAFSPWIFNPADGMVA